MRGTPDRPATSAAIAAGAGWRSLMLIGLAVTAALLLAFYVGGQRALGRVDPNFTIPFLLLVMLWPAWLWRRLALRHRFKLYGLLILVLLVGQLALTVGLAANIGGRLAAQLVMVALAAGIAALVTEALLLLAKRRGPWLLLMAVVAVPIWFLFWHMLLAQLYTPRSAGAEAKQVVMLTGLPLRWSGSANIADILSGQRGDDPALRQLQALGPVELVDSVAERPMAIEQPLLIVHPRALAPAELVAIDAHVRRGGRAVIFADALSSWPSPHPLGDPRNPPITSLLTPLLDHWGIVLDAVIHGENRKEWVTISDYGVALLSAGHFSKWPAGCSVFAENHVLGCQIGAGNVWIVGDADALHQDLWGGAGGSMAHLTESEIFPWLAGRLWEGRAGQSLLQPLWMGRKNP